MFQITIYNFHAKYIKNKFGSSSGADVFMKVREVIDEYNSERGKVLANVKQTKQGKLSLQVVKEFMKTYLLQEIY